MEHQSSINKLAIISFDVEFTNNVWSHKNACIVLLLGLYFKNFFLSLVFCTLWRQSLIRSSPADFGRIVLLPCNLFIGLAPWVSVPLSERGRPCEKLPSPSLSPGKTW